MQEEKKKYEEIFSAKDRRMADLKGYTNSLSQELSQAKLVAERSYVFGFHIAKYQAKHFFVDKELKFNLLDPSRFMSNILSEETQVVAKGEEVSIEVDHNADPAPIEFSTP